MAFNRTSPFTRKRVFGVEDPKLVKVPPAPETHEPRRPRRSYLAPNDLGDQLARALSGSMPNIPPAPRKIEVERIKRVPTVPSAAPDLSE